jgi:AAA family ATP:ADP antiporter
MSNEAFGKLRAFLWPVHRHELRKFVPMLLMFFLITFNYNILRAAKDALVVTAPSSGAEAIPFIKVWVILPMAFLVTYLFTRLSNRLSREGVFYAMMTIFISFFFIFTFVLYPLRDSLHPHELADKLQDMLPTGFRGIIALFRNWTFTLFYVASEMWSTIIMSVLFWGFANEVTSVNDAKRFYGLLGVSANFSGIVSGLLSSALSHITFNPSLPFGVDAWGQSVLYLNAVVIVAGIVCTFLFRWLQNSGHGYQRTVDPTSNEETPKIKMGMRKNFAYLAKSKYLIYIAVIVVMYNIAMNLVEVVWKDQVKQLYPNPSDFNAYMGQVLTAIGVVSTITSVFISGNLIRQFSWTFSAMISPIILVVTGVGFFAFLLFKDSGIATGIAGVVGYTPLAMVVLFGSLQNCFSRASKYTVFDTTKELAFVPLSPESKLKGKAAIDGVGSRLGKSGGSVIHQALLLGFGSVALSTPYVGLLLLFVIGAWMLAAKSLGRQFNELTSHKEVIVVPEDEPSQAEGAINEPAR